MKDIIYYFFSIFAIILLIYSIQYKDKKNILLIQNLSYICYFFSYLLKSATLGWIIQLYCICKNTTFYQYENKAKKVPKYILAIFFILLLSIFIYFFLNATKENIFSILIILIINIIYLVSSYLKNPIHIRLGVLLAALIWVIYNYMVGTYILIIGNLFEIIFAIISIERNRKK